MIIKGTNRTILIFSIIVLPLFHSCDLDHVESNYSNFELAEKEGLFEKGWIPSDIVFTSMTEIYQRTNVDINTCIFSYNLSKTNFDVLKLKIIPTSTIFEKPHGIRIPIQWKESVDKLDHYMYFIKENNDSVYIAIDEINNTIYGWRNNITPTNTR